MHHPLPTTVKKRLSPLLVLLCGLLAFTGCKEATLGPELAGDLEGIVYDFETKAILPGAGITTSPPTSALVTDENGRFVLDDVPPGNYTITATRNGYVTSTTSVSVRENRMTQANVFLKKEEPKASTKTDLAVEILNWAARTRNDSAFVDVEYRVRNTGDAAIPAYEVYFRIGTPGENFFQEEKGANLNTTQADIGRFTRYTRKQQAQEVVVDNFWFQGKDSK